MLVIQTRANLEIAESHTVLIADESSQFSVGELLREDGDGEFALINQVVLVIHSQAERSNDGRVGTTSFLTQLIN
jgi:hypothetical protein